MSCTGLQHCCQTPRALKPQAWPRGGHGNNLFCSPNVRAWSQSETDVVLMMSFSSLCLVYVGRGWFGETVIPVGCQAGRPQKSAARLLWLAKLDLPVDGQLWWCHAVHQRSLTSVWWNILWAGCCVLQEQLYTLKQLISCFEKIKPKSVCWCQSRRLLWDPYHCR